MFQNAIKAHWQAVIGEPVPKAQWMPQEFGVTYWEPQHERSLLNTLEEIEADVEKRRVDDTEKIAELGKAVADHKQEIIELKAKFENDISDLRNRNTFLSKHNEELRGRLKDALEPPLGIKEQGAIASGVMFASVDSEDHFTIVDIDNPVPVVIPPVTEINGVTPPKSGATKTVWDCANAFLVAGEKPTRAQVVGAAVNQGVKEATAAAAYSQWCRYNSINSKDPSQPFELKERRKGEAKKQNDEAPKAPVTRYFSHPESSCVLTTEDGSHPGDTCEELTKEEYEKFKGELAERLVASEGTIATNVFVLPPPPVVILPPPPPPF